MSANKFLALPNFPRTLKSGVGAHFVQNTLKYNIKTSNFEVGHETTVFDPTNVIAIFAQHQ